MVSIAARKHRGNQVQESATRSMTLAITRANSTGQPWRQAAFALALG
jgi:hypothetical protein